MQIPPLGLGTKLSTRTPRFCLLSLATAVIIAGCSNLADTTTTTTATATPTDPGTTDPSAIHKRIITLDSHLDTPALLVQPGFNIVQRHDPLTDYSQVDLPRMQEGGLDGGFWVIYTAQGPLTQQDYDRVYQVALKRSHATKAMVEDNPESFELAFTADDAQRIAAAGKRIVYQSIENAYPLGKDLDRLEQFYELGVRMVGPVHFANNQFGDSATDPRGPAWNGLSPLGRSLVAKANELGMVLDASHSHDLVFDQLLALSKTPIVLSHSGAKAIYDHPRNIDDERLLKLAESGGVIQMNALGAYLTALKPQPTRRAALQEIFKKNAALDKPTVASRAAMLRERRAVDSQYPPALATFEDYMTHFLHVLKLIGPDHVGIGADWDGGGGVVGMRDITEFPRVTKRLLEEGYSEEDLAKIWSGNVLRLLRQAEQYKLELADE